ncbi:hypothetical protein [Parenemella sanctibonifatiensis]|uniref:hypothetical protein n=1 Tax=Parenemella sanctibonifatiensis TaxID=2016505 RepID=UPI001E31A95A|nr:hypothetical protein [Parenemella sanctibonifatiensis]
MAREILNRDRTSGRADEIQRLERVLGSGGVIIPVQSLKESGSQDTFAVTDGMICQFLGQ